LTYHGLKKTRIITAPTTPIVLQPSSERKQSPAKKPKPAGQPTDPDTYRIDWEKVGKITMFGKTGVPFVAFTHRVYLCKDI
tara:strand:+ start:488 stop:730 length:243 start_codon:yes stop_codon:yes gene_type:complete